MKTIIVFAFLLYIVATIKLPMWALVTFLIAIVLILKRVIIDHKEL